MTYLRNAWYIAAWDYEISREMMARVILEESILLYRKEDGAAVAMSNRCPHRMAPLNKGKLQGDAVECPYHGLVFDANGQCIHNPHPGGNGPIPPRMKLRPYPVIERHGAIWIWMGEKTADAALIPDYHWITDTAHYRTNRGVIEIACNYQSVADNLLDLTHLSYVHPSGLGPNPNDVIGEHLEHVIENQQVWCKRTAKNVRASMDFQLLNPRIKDVAVDKTHNVRWIAPAHSLISVNYIKAGTEATDATGADIGHMATPISPTKTLMFWNISRNFLLDSAEVDARMEQFAHIAIDAQDAVIMAEQQRMMGSEWDINRLNPVCLPNDVSVNRARNILRRMIDEENGLIAKTTDAVNLTADID